MVEAVRVPPDLVPDIWPLVSDMLARASLRDGLSDVEVIGDRVRDGAYVLWVAWDGAAALGAWATQISVANGKAYCTIVVCGGRDLARWVHLVNDVEDYARKSGCIGVRIIGRKGWARVLDGFRPVAIVLEKEF